MLKYKIGDKVIVKIGRDRGREGVIEKIFPKKNKALVPGINIYKRHIKARIAADGKGGMYELPRPILLSKLAIIDPKTGKPTRVGFKFEGDKKVRFAKKSGTILDKPSEVKVKETKKNKK